MTWTAGLETLSVSILQGLVDSLLWNNLSAFNETNKPVYIFCPVVNKNLKYSDGICYTPRRELDIDLET